MSADPDFTDAAAALRKLFPSPADVEAALRGALARARAVSGPAGELAAGLVEVMDVAHRWNLRAAADPDAVINASEAAGEIINAVSRGLAME